jgi:hypothetical protein
MAPMNHPFDYEGSPALREGPDLREMSRIHMPSVVRAMTSASVVVVVYPDDAYTILKGEAAIQDVIDTGVTSAMPFLVLQIANDTQAEMIAGALQVIEDGQMTPVRVQVLREMLTSVQDVRGAKN